MPVVFVSDPDLQKICLGHFGKYHNTFCLSPNLAEALFLLSLGAIVSPKRNWLQCLWKIFWGTGGGEETNKRVLWYLLKCPIAYFSTLRFTFATHVLYHHKCQLIYKINVHHCWLFSNSDKYDNNETKQDGTHEVRTPDCKTLNKHPPLPSRAFPQVD